MTIGERIKKIRVFRKMTMDELGGALGFEGKNMSVRISQYETGAHIPGEDMILKLADALHCNYKAISDYSLGAGAILESIVPHIKEMDLDSLKRELIIRLRGM